MPTAVVTSVHPVGIGLAVGTHHLARELSRRGWRVALISDPASLVHVLGAPWHASARERVRVALRGPGTDDGVIVVTPLTVLPLARTFGVGSRSILRLWPWLSRPILPRYLARQGFRNVDLLFFDGPLPATLVDVLHPRRTVLRLFDDTSEEPPWPPALAKEAERLAAAADLVAITAPSLAGRARALGARRIHLMPNGADLAHFATPAPEPPDIAALPRPRIVYAGAIASWVDVELMDEVARRMPKASFIWIGPNGATTIKPRPNVHVLGPRPYAALPGYLQHCDIGVIPFNRERHPRLVDSIHPLKLYDYLAAGLPVVAAPWAELRRIAPPITFASTVEEFHAGVAAAANTGRIDARTFLTRATWTARVDDLLSALGVG